MKPLTQLQAEILETLRKRGADFTAAATERHWLAGKAYYLDTRNSARRGLVRKFNKANQQAEQTQ